MERHPGWLKQRKNRRRLLVITLIAVVIVGICLAIPLGVILCGTKEAEETGKVCLTPECIHTASKVLDWMDPSINPCDDFYEFACGNFIKQTKIPDDESSVSTSSVIDDLVSEQLRTLIEEPIQPDDSKPFVLLKKLYKACINKTLIEEIGLRDIKQMIRSFGGWPVLEGDNWKESAFDWKHIVYKFEKTGFYTDYLLTFVVDVDARNSSRRIINIDQPFLVLSREFLMRGLEDELVKAYYDYMVDIAIIFGANETVAKRDMLKSLDFEAKLANISVPNEERRDSVALYNPFTVRELQDEFPSIPWLEYFNKLLAPHEKVTKDELIIVNSYKYLTEFEKLMKVTPKRIQANYLIWRSISFAITYLTEELRNRQLRFNTVLTGEREPLPRWKECVNDCTTSLDIAANALYVRKYFKEDARKSAEELVSNIKAEFSETLQKVDWMDDETRKNALGKADMMITHIGYPTELLDDAKLEKYYQGLEVDDKSYFKSSLNISLFANKSSYKKLRLPVNKTEWSVHSGASAVNAYYNPNENSMQFPAGILQGVYFKHDRPNYMNYGGIGFIIGHEITHGFDDYGRKYDSEGNLADWWVPETETAFVKKTQCIIGQYGNYTVPEIGQKLNGINTQGENIADIGGVKQAYLAYDRLVEENGEEPRLPGLNYTGRQMFWISAANIWCSKTRPEVLKQRVTEDDHSPDRFRILGAFSNIHEFAKDFECKSGTNMNPEHKCHLW